MTILAIMAAVDLRRRGRQATRWREYLFLLACVMAAMVYGILNDQITSRISWEYFYYGKELARTLGPNTPPDPAALHRQAALVGMKATWSVGLLIGAAMLIANNPRIGRPPLPYPALHRRMGIIFASALIAAIILGWAGYNGWLNHASSDFAEMARDNLWRPRRFIAVWGIHLGGYVGGAIGACVACAGIYRRSKRAPNRVT